MKKLIICRGGQHGIGGELQVPAYDQMSRLAAAIRCHVPETNVTGEHISESVCIIASIYPHIAHSAILIANALRIDRVELLRSLALRDGKWTDEQLNAAVLEVCNQQVDNLIVVTHGALAKQILAICGRVMIDVTCKNMEFDFGHGEIIDRTVRAVTPIP